MRKSGKWIAVILIVCLLAGYPVQASQVQNDAVYGISTNEISEWPVGPECISDTAVLMDFDTGTVLYNKGADEKRYPASITKVMTALVAVEHAEMEDEVTFTETCLADQTSDSSNFHMQVGEVMTMEQCLMTLLIYSANDVATQIAEHVAGSVADFAQMMNERAAEIGCTNTHFVNASGMPDENHYTSAYDMALIFQEGLKNETFRRIIGTTAYVIGPTNKTAETRQLYTHQPLMAPNAPQYYEGCIGGKTGVTSISGNTLVTGVEKEGMTLIAVSMRASELAQSCQDHKQLYDYGFANFKKIEVPGGYVVIPENKELADLQISETAEEHATLQNYYYPGEYYVGCGKVEEPVVEVTPEIEEKQELEVPEKIAQEVEKLTNQKMDEKMRQIYWYIILVLTVLIGAGLIMAVVGSLKKSGKKKKKKKSRKKKTS